MRPASGGTGQYDEFDIYVEADATPVFVRTAYAAVDGNGLDGSDESDLVFLDFGGPIVEPPTDQTHGIHPPRGQSHGLPP